MKKNATYLLTLFLLTFFTPKLCAITDTIKTLIITEIYASNYQTSYVELTNVGTEPVNLSHFKLASSDHTKVFPTTVPIRQMMLPEVMLMPGSSYVIAYIADYYDNHGWKTVPWANIRKYGLDKTHPEILAKLDTALYWDEDLAGNQGGLDSISISAHLLGVLQYNNALFLEYHFGGDSVVVDQARFAPTSGGQPDRNEIYNAVAGVPNAYLKYVLVRKTNVTKGNLNWDDARGNSIEDSEWLPIPPRVNSLTGSIWRNNTRFYTTLKHHGNTSLNNESVSSNNIDIDWLNKTMAVPWGIYRDSVMNYFDLAGGIAWQYHLSPSFIDSSSRIVVSGDKLTLYAVGETLEQMDFTINTKNPANNMNLVFPVNLQLYNAQTQTYSWSTPFYVTNESLVDTIGDVKFGTRVDSLFKYIVKAPNASWEIEWVDDKERVDLKNGDILKVSAQNGTVKQYLIDVGIEPERSTNAMLSAITWPDAPAYLKESPQWKEDTIPNFKSAVLTYALKVPYGTENVPALTAFPMDPNAKISVERARLINGPVQDRTTTFTVTAEDDTTVLIYSVVFSEDMPDEFVQPFTADPIFTDLIHMRVWNERAIEISNPGNQPLDLSNYMIVAGAGSSPAEIITQNIVNYDDRFLRYVPGYNYQSLDQWNVNPHIIEKDFDVNPIIEPGGSFVLARTRDAKWFTDPFQIHYDVVITNRSYAFDSNGNPRLNEEGTNTKAYYIDGSGINYATMWRYDFGQLCMLKILNDSVKSGLKPVIDPNDFELVDMLGHWNGIRWEVTGVPIPSHEHRMERKSQFWKGATLPGILGSFGATAEESEWKYSQTSWAISENDVKSGAIGSHSFDPIFDYASTVNSFVYKVSTGYASPQLIKGVAPGTIVSGFMSNIIKAHEDQILELVGKGSDDVLVTGDVLKVTSADALSSTEYVIELGIFSSDAVLVAKTGSGYTIAHSGNEGTISGIQFGASIDEVLNNVIKPTEAIMSVLDINENLVPLQLKNFNEEYVNTKASNRIFFEVIAEDGVSTILYQLLLNGSASDAYLYSDFYQVDQDFKLVSYVPQGTNVQTLFTHLYPNAGASVKLLNKAGDERMMGDVVSDDEIVVTSADQTVQQVYFIRLVEEGNGSKAYVLSDVLNVDQIQKQISGLLENTPYETFISLIKPAPEATVVLLDNEQQTVTSGVVAHGFTLVVSSGDGLKVVNYTISKLTSVDPRMIEALKIYPNPASDRIFVEGAGMNDHLVIKNISGRIVKLIDNKELLTGSVSVEDLSPGIYLIYTNNKGIYSRPVKLIKM
jgi:hypothetical protein